tara:strand:+ start:1196 stop:2938 length:1743 start_codon:yes stop_codon:yes gene_type:complete
MINLPKITYQIIPPKMRWKLLIVIFLIIFSGIVELLSIAIIFPLLTFLFEPRQIDFLGSSINLERIVSNANIFELFFYVIIFFNIIILVKNLIIFFSQYIKIRFFVNLKTELSARMYKSYMSKDLHFHIENDSSVLIRNIFTEVNLFGKKVLTQQIELIQNVIIFIGLITILLNIRFFETLIFTSIFIFLGLIYFLIFRVSIDNLGSQRVHYDGFILKYLRQSFDGYREIIIYNSQNFFKNNLLKKIYQRETVGKKISIISLIPKHLLEIIIVFFITFASLYLYSKEPEFKNLIPELALILTISIRLYPLVNKLIINFNVLKFTQPSAYILHNELKNINIQTNNILNPNINDQNISFKHDIEFKNVSFKYPKSKEDVLNGVSIKFKKGQVIAILGPSGSGKSTFLDLVAGFILPTNGEIAIDGSKNTNLSKWREKISYVSQNIFLTDETIKNNITFGNQKKFDEELYLKSINKSNAVEFIEKLEKGSDTIVGEYGSKFSGGQRQRINIARAIYKNPEILIFDEATSALDEKNEEKIFNSLKDLSNNLTIFIATHKKSLIEKCDIAIEIKDNKILQLYQTK